MSSKTFDKWWSRSKVCQFDSREEAAAWKAEFDRRYKKNPFAKAPPCDWVKKQKEKENKLKDNKMAMTKKARSEAAKKAARTRRRNAAKTPVRKRRRPAKKGFLSQIGGVESRNAFRSMASGAVGGTLYLVYEDQVTIQNMTPEKKGAIAVIGAYFLAVMGKRPNVAAGITGAAAYDFFLAKGLLNDPMQEQMSRMQYADPLRNIPETLGDDEMLYLSAGMHDDDDMMYLQDDDGNMYLQDDAGNLYLADEQYLPDYAATYRY